MHVRFVVEHAGCPSCRERVRAALATVGAVQSIEIDEADDSASVRAVLPRSLSADAVDETLREASVGAGHEYRIRAGSWHASV